MNISEISSIGEAHYYDVVSCYVSPRGTISRICWTRYLNYTWCLVPGTRYINTVLSKKIKEKWENLQHDIY